jgi:hypothetical protein
MTVPPDRVRATEREGRFIAKSGMRASHKWEQHSVVRRGTRVQLTNGLAAPGKPDLSCSATRGHCSPQARSFSCPGGRPPGW